jgi:ribA/ribD-fused uncharacterized protein
VEHFFQSQKFKHRPEIFRAIKAARTPGAAKKIAKENKRLRRRDWVDIREHVMRTALKAKFEQHADIAHKLLATGKSRIVENAPDDRFWGVGDDGRGENRVGKMLMRIRGHLAARPTRRISRRKSQAERLGGSQ